ncbi:MAG: diguanylate cyclase [Alphaproteobacteria bacterium]|nr:diguanylate cyclase [Alphaproteobacteria bacterium]
MAVGPDDLPSSNNGITLWKLVRWSVGLAMLAGLGSTLIARYRSRLPDEGTHDTPAIIASKGSKLQEDRIAAAAHFSLGYVLPPLWLPSALADWACHRYSRIEENASVRESAMHLLLQAEMAVVILAGLFLEITSPVILTMVAAYLLHEATVYVDLRIAVGNNREVTPAEQMVHSVMEMMPLVGIWLVSILHEDEVRALIGASPRPSDYSLRLKEHSPPTSYRAILLTAATLFGALPYIEEFWRCASRAAAQTKAPRMVNAPGKSKTLAG